MSISKNSQNLELDKKRHSMAHLLAAAVGQMFPETQYGVGPVIENGCYYDFILPRTLIPEDLPLIEAKMKEMLKRHLSYKVQEISLEDAIVLFEKKNQPLKVELLNDLATRGTTNLSEEERESFEGVKVDPLETPNIKDVDPLEGVRVVYQEKFSENGFTFPANKDLKDRAKEMSQNMTKAEQLVWFNLLESDKTGFKWTKQKVIDNYIVDFYCHTLGLVVEIDGDSHSEKQEYDEIRTKFLNNFNIDVIRFSNDEVYNNLDGVKLKLKEIINVRQKQIGENLPLYTESRESKNLPFNSELGEFVKLPLPRGQNPQDFGGLPGGLPTITIYRIVDESTGEILFEDLCKGPHVEHVKELKNCGFALDKFSAAYWRGDQERDIRMQRLYALVFETKEEVAQFQEQREEAKKRDHRKLGQEMEIFMISEDVGAGLPLYLPNGATIRQLLEKYCYQEAKKSGYQYVYTPHIGKEDLFKKSGHLDHYADGMYAPIDMVNLKGEGALEGGKTEKFYLKPMNCPMHHQIYLNKPKSYRDLPYRLYEYGTVYRYEESGTLTGMIRVRGFTQNDAHVYCQTNQMREVIEEALNRMTKTYSDVGINDYKIRFSLPDFENDKEKFDEETEEWRNAVSAMRQALDEMGVEYYDAVGEAAFYGPKIDIQVKNVNGKEDSLSTIQVDYSIAPKFGITDKNDKGEDEIPAIIHMALMGSVDRFMAFMLEMTAGRIPFWLAPTQVKILTINTQPETLEYVEKVKSILAETVLMKPLK